MRFGIFTTLRSVAWPDVLSLWQRADASGWDAACVIDHFMPNTPDARGDTLEAWTALAALALATRRMRIGTLVSGNTFRHPAVLAKMAANVDIISGGRLMCGIGAGWQENEHVRYGIPLPPWPERLARLDEACQILLRLWTDDVTTFDGAHFQLREAPLMPKPVQRPHPELMIGGTGEKVMLRIVAKYADHWNAGTSGPARFARKRAVLEAHCAAIGRDPRTLTTSTDVGLVFDPAGGAALAARLPGRLELTADEAAEAVLTGPISRIQDRLGALREAGVDTCFIVTNPLDAEALERFMADVAPTVRDAARTPRP
jgi:F420-dependent oxidoreductase-like protein